MTTTVTGIATVDETAAQIADKISSLASQRTALVIIDAQNDFCDDVERAALPVGGGGRAVDVINRLLTKKLWDHVVVSQDWHVNPGDHFSDTPDYIDTWPAHCVAGTEGAYLHSRLLPASGFDGVDATVRKGMHAASYSAFDPDVTVHDSRNRSAPNLAAWLRERGVRRVVIVGIETAHCVAASAIDAAGAGLEVIVPLAATASLDETASAAAIYRMLAAGDVTVFGQPQSGEPQ